MVNPHHRHKACKVETSIRSQAPNHQAQKLGKQGVITGLTLCTLAIHPLGQRAEAIAVVDNTPAPLGFNQFAAPADPNDGNTYILSRGYVFQVSNSNYSADSVSAYIYDVFGFNGIVPTARLELRTYDGSTPGQLLESLLINIGTDSNNLSSFTVPSWNLTANTNYWIGLNWASPYNQGNSMNAPSGMFGWSVASPSFPVMGAGFTDLGFKQYVIGPGYPGGAWANASCSIQCNSFRINASLSTADVPAPLPLFGVATALAYSRNLRKNSRNLRKKNT